MRIGLVGLALSGKSTLFGLLTGTPAATNGKPEARVGSALVPDRRIDCLSQLYKPRKTTYARIEFVDIPGLVPGEEKKANPFLEEIRKVDAIVYVLRAFANPDVPHLMGDIDPLRDWELLEMEFLLSDLDLFEKRAQRLREARKKPKGWAEELALLEKCRDALGEGKTLRDLALADSERELLQGYSLLTEKPVIPVVNVDEKQFTTGNYPGKAALTAKLSAQNLPHLEICGQLELEINALEGQDRELFMQDLGITESGIQRLARIAYDTLGLISFFTVGEDEVRAWTIRKGTPAPEAAGKIHSDIARGFIRAEVLAYQDLLAAGSVARAREMGLYRLEGKEYLMQDGDITNFRFNV